MEKFNLEKHQEKKGGVYCILNTVNGRFYVGSTIGFRSRWKGHLNSLKRGDHHSLLLQKSFDKHKEQSFQFFILDIIEDRFTIRQREQKYLDVLQPYLPDVGFNRSRSATGIDSPITITHYRQKLGKPIVGYNLDGSFKGQYLCATEAAEQIGEGLTAANIRVNCRHSSRAGQYMFKHINGPYPDQITPHKHPLKDKVRLGVGQKIVATRRRTGSYVMSEERKQQNRIARLGCKNSPESNLKRSLAHKGKIWTKEHRERNDKSRQKPIIAFDWLGYPINRYDSLKSCAASHGVGMSTIFEYIKDQRPRRSEFLVYLPKERLKLAA